MATLILCIGLGLSGPLVLLAGLAAFAVQVHAAEVLQVTGPDRLLIGDGNRSTSVRLACVAVPAEARVDATELLRRMLPRHRRINLRPIGSRDGVMLARISTLDAEGTDLAEALLSAGLAQAVPCA